jgi:hypothetical protein
MSSLGERLEDVREKYPRLKAECPDAWGLMEEAVAKATEQRLLVLTHALRRGHDRCWEADQELYLAFGIAGADGMMPPVEEHRKRCDEYRAARYGLPLEEEPCSLVERLQKINAGLADRVAAQSDILTRRAEGIHLAREVLRGIIEGRGVIVGEAKRALEAI